MIIKDVAPDPLVPPRIQPLKEGDENDGLIWGKYPGLRNTLFMTYYEPVTRLGAWADDGGYQP